eukprot:6172920-Pleurochrysis_carterae.AAC.1
MEKQGRTERARSRSPGCTDDDESAQADRCAAARARASKAREGMRQVTSTSVRSGTRSSALSGTAQRGVSDTSCSMLRTHTQHAHQATRTRTKKHVCGSTHTYTARLAKSTHGHVPQSSPRKNALVSVSEDMRAHCLGHCACFECIVRASLPVLGCERGNRRQSTQSCLTNRVAQLAGPRTRAMSIYSSPV